MIDDHVDPASDKAAPISARVRSMDLNLLRILGVIFETRSVTLAARRLGLTQSAISHSLRKLRYSFEDELVVRNGHRLILTPRGEELDVPLSRWLNDLEKNLFSPERFDPSVSDRKFFIATTDQFAQIVLPKLVRVLKKQAPDVHLVLRSWNAQKDFRELELGEIDLGVGVSANSIAGVQECVLYEESFESIVRKNHPFLKSKRGPKDFVSYPHTLATTTPGHQGVVDMALEKHGLTRDVLYRVANFSVAPSIVEATDSILTAPKRFVRIVAKKYNVEVFEPPVALPSFRMKLFWHARNQSDEGNIWLRELIRKVAA